MALARARLRLRARRSPPLYTLVETAKLNDVDPAKYLLEAVRAADRGETLFP